MCSTLLTRNYFKTCLQQACFFLTVSLLSLTLGLEFKAVDRKGRKCPDHPLEPGEIYFCVLYYVAITIDTGRAFPIEQWDLFVLAIIFKMLKLTNS